MTSDYFAPFVQRVLMTAVVVFGGVVGTGAQTVVEPPARDVHSPFALDARDLGVVPFGTVQLADTQAGTQPAGAKPRPCDGCPPRRVGRTLLQVTIINGFYELANLARGQVTAHITPKTWWANMQQGWVWDLDDFAVNQVGHPYQGNNYFNAARANGLNFYEAAAATAFGSATWEFFGETNHASLNDLINTTLGGIALGEMFHRAAWLVRDPQKTGKSRLWNEIGATVIDPITGVNRFISGDASAVTAKPAELTPSTLGSVWSTGVLWRGSNTGDWESSVHPFLEIDALYGDLTAGRSATPYDAFSLRLRLGGGSALSEARVRGRLYGRPVSNGRMQFSVVQSYDFQANDAYHFGAQSLEATIGSTKGLGDRTSMVIIGWGGFTVLGAIDSLPLDESGVPIAGPPKEEGEPSGGQGVSEGPRYYDYGPGSSFGVLATFLRNGRTFGSIAYEGHQLYSLDGVRANHILQRLRGDLLVPVAGAFGLGVSAEYFARKTYYQDAAQTRKKYDYPQVRAYITWRPR